MLATIETPVTACSDATPIRQGKPVASQSPVLIFRHERGACCSRSHAKYLVGSALYKVNGKQRRIIYVANLCCPRNGKHACLHVSPTPVSIIP